MRVDIGIAPLLLGKAGHTHGVRIHDALKAYVLTQKFGHNSVRGSGYIIRVIHIIYSVIAHHAADSGLRCFSERIKVDGLHFFLCSLGLFQRKVRV